jgi:hypothetical protein
MSRQTNAFNRGSAPDRARDSWQRPGSFKKGHQKRGGRQKGTRNRLGPDVKRALLAAVTLIGDNGAGRGGAFGYFTWLGKCDPTLFYTELWIRLLDIEAYEAARGRGTPIKTEIDSEETTEAKIRRWQIAWSSVPNDLAPMVERYMQLAVFWPKEFVRLFAAAFLTPPRGWQSRLQQQRGPV